MRVLVGLFAGLAALISTSTGAVAQVAFSQTTPGSYTFIVPTSGVYSLDMYGAGGGAQTLRPDLGGPGARVFGEVTLAAGDALTFVVGRRGASARDVGGGGGGSFAYITTGPRLLMAAGGGGGAYLDFPGRPGLGSSSQGSDGTGTFSGAGGQGGNGGAGGTWSFASSFPETSGGGGGGWLSPGTDGALSPGSGGGTAPAFNGGAGYTTGGAAGGLGGGGGSGNYGAGGGGGYSGGGGGGNNTGFTGSGGGGGSYTDPAFRNVVTQDGARAGDGSVVLTLVAATPAPVPTLSEWALVLLGTALAGGAMLLVQRRRGAA